MITNIDVTTSRDEEFESSMTKIEPKEEGKQKESEKADKKED